MAHLYWPLFDLRVRTPRIELRNPTDEDACEIAALAAKGVHAPDFMPFTVPWTQQPSPQLERGTLQHFWGLRANWSVEELHLNLVVECDGELVGCQGFGAKKFPILRTISSGSWLGVAHQGKGLGKEMRAAMLHLAFEGLGTRIAYSAAFEDNAPSRAVSTAVGYEENGDNWEVRQGVAARQVEFKLSRERWLERRRDDIVIENLEPCLPMFGLAPDLSPLPEEPKPA